MVCSKCNGTVGSPGHNRRTCPKKDDGVGDLRRELYQGEARGPAPAAACSKSKGGGGGSAAGFRRVGSELLASSAEHARRQIALLSPVSNGSSPSGGRVFGGCSD